MAKTLSKPELQALFNQKESEVSDFHKAACDSLTSQLRGMKAGYTWNNWTVEAIEVVQLLDRVYRIKVRVLGPSDSEGYEFTDLLSAFTGFRK